jgi:hypothetical protein
MEGGGLNGMGDEVPTNRGPYTGQPPTKSVIYAALVLPPGGTPRFP